MSNTHVVEIVCAVCGWRAVGSARVPMEWQRVIVSAQHWCPQHIIVTTNPASPEKEKADER